MLPASPSRRRLLAGLATVVVVAGSGITLRQCARERALPLPAALQTLSDEEARLWLALLPVILGSRLPEQQPQRQAALDATLLQLDRQITHLPTWRQQELHGLSATLAWAPLRILLAGSWRPWHRASSGEIRAFLHRWQHSPVEQLNLAYRSLVETAHLAWYADNKNQLQTGYPGPPGRIRDLLGTAPVNGRNGT